MLALEWGVHFDSPSRDISLSRKPCISTLVMFEYITSNVCRYATREERTWRISAVRGRRFLSSLLDRLVVLYWVNKDLSSDEAKYYSDWIRKGRLRPLPTSNGQGASRAHLGVVAGSRVWLPPRPKSKQSTVDLIAALKRSLKSLEPSSSIRSESSSFHPHH